jgi:hypothetical protein
MYTALLFVISTLLIGGGAAVAAPAMTDEGKPIWVLLVPATIAVVAGITAVLFAVHSLIG